MNENFVAREPIFEKVDNYLANIRKLQAEMEKKIDAIVVNPYIPYKEDPSCNILV